MGDAIKHGFLVPDDGLLKLGDDGDGVLLNRSTILAADTILGSVLVGTVESQAIAANSTMIANATSDADMALYINKGGNSQMGLWLDGSAGDTALMAASGASVDHYIAGTKVLDHAAGAFAFQEATTISSTSTITINGVTSVVFNETGADVDFRVEAQGNSNMIVVDGLLTTSSMGLGGAVGANSFLHILGNVVNRAMASSQGLELQLDTATFTTTNADPTTIANAYRVFVGIPTFAGANANQSFTTVATLGVYSPTAGTNVTFGKAVAIRAYGGILIDPVSASGTTPSISARGCLFEVNTGTQSLATASSTQAIGAVNSFGVITLTNTVATLTYTNATTVYIAGVPVASTNVAFSNPASALWIGGGALRVGTAGTAIGALWMEGNTSGRLTLTVAAAAGTWTMTLPTGVAAAGGYQLADGAGDGVCSWTAAACLPEAKHYLDVTPTPQDALDRILKTEIKLWNYKDGMGTGDRETVYCGPSADKSPWYMHYGGGILNPINAFGDTVLAFQATQQKIQQVDGEVEALRARVAFLEGKLKFLEVPHVQDPD